MQDHFTTNAFANEVSVKPETIRRCLCVDGHYLGVRPAVKLPNGRLLWPAAEVRAVVRSGAVKKGREE